MTPKQMEQQCKAMGHSQEEIEKVMAVFRASGEADALSQAKLFLVAKRKAEETTAPDLKEPPCLKTLHSVNVEVEKVEAANRWGWVGLCLSYLAFWQ